MSNADSLLNFAYFSDAIERAPTDADKEAFVRSMIRHASEQAPLDVILMLARAIQDNRNAELAAEGGAN